MPSAGRFLRSFFGLGLVPWAPGTFGTLGGVAIAVFLRSDAVLAGAAGVTFAAGLLLARGMPGKDPGWFVVDEVAAYLLVPIGLGRDWKVLLGAFCLFRLFDIWKPWPIRALESVPGGWGVMLDDVLAAVFAHAVLRLVLAFA